MGDFADFQRGGSSVKFAFVVKKSFEKIFCKEKALRGFFLSN